MHGVRPWYILMGCAIEELHLLRVDSCGHSFIDSFRWHVQNSLPFSGASSVLLCYTLIPATLPHQLFFHPLSPHLVIYFLAYLSILLFPNSYIILFWEFYFLPFSVHVQTNVIYLTLDSCGAHHYLLIVWVKESTEVWYETIDLRKLHSVWEYSIRLKFLTHMQLWNTWVSMWTAAELGLC
jgi:hypothetical protein